MDELTPSLAFLEKYENKYGHDHMQFQICSLEEALKKSCFQKIENRKMLALYLHSDDDAFSKVFYPLLQNESLSNLLEIYCLFLPWEITSRAYHDIINKMLSDYNELEIITNRIDNKKAALLFISPVKNTIAVFGVLQGRMKEHEIIDSVSSFCASFEVELKCEEKLVEAKNKDIIKINSNQYQQMMFDMLGDRDYDAFEKHEHVYLKEKIAFAFYGPPQSVDGINATSSMVDGYDEKQKRKIEAAYNKICGVYAPYAEYEGQIIISFIYNCTEPLPQEKEKRVNKAAKEKTSYDPETDILPLPIFVLRKCVLKSSNSKNLCRLFIDHDLRVYKTWKDYITNNKLPACLMVLPRNGRYRGDTADRVLLETHLAPSCHVKADILRGLDITSTVLGVGSGAIFAAAMIPAVTVAPLALVGAGIVGAGVGVYSLVRSAVNLFDRHSHSEDMSISNADARGSYINIVAGSLGFVGAGAATVMSQLVSQGINVGRTAQSAVTAINVINLGASGAGILHSSYEIYVQWREENVAPSFLTVVQLSSSVLFFGNAVYNFRTGAAIVEETQTKVLQEYQDGLRSNRHRKTFNKMRLETIRQNEGNVAAAQADVIATIRTIPDRNEVFAVLTRSNKMFNKSNIKFAASGGKITLNGVAVDISMFGELSKTEQSTFLLELPQSPTPTRAQATAISRMVDRVFRVDYVNVCGQMLSIPQWNFATILNIFQPAVQELLLKCLQTLLNNIQINLNDVFKTIFPGRDLLETVLALVINFFKTKMALYEQEYIEQRESERLNSPNFDESDFAARFNASTDTARRALLFFERAVARSFSGDDVIEGVLREMIEYFTKWITEQMYKYEENRKMREVRGLARSAQICSVCGGFCYP